MKKNFLESAFFFLLLIFSCKNQYCIIKNSDFKIFLKDIPTIDLPYSTTCGLCCDTKEIEIDTSLVKKFNPDNLEIVGKLIDKEKYIGILYAGSADYLVPILITYNSYGDVISKRQFMQDYCGKTVDFYDNHYFNIDKQLQIKVIDSSFVFKMDPNNIKVIDTLKKDLKFSKFEISEDGEIIKE